MKWDNIEYFIFDLDGTLIDSNNFQNNLDVDLVHLFDQSMTKAMIIQERDEFFKKTKGLDIYLNYCEYLRKKYHLKITKNDILEKRRVMEREKALQIKLKKDADEFIKLLKKNGIHLTLATVSRKEILNIYMNKNQFIKKKIDLNKCFDVIITKDDVKLKKPNPEIYLRVIDKLKIKDLSKCLVIEDSLNGVIAAKKANLKVIGIYDEYSCKDQEKIIQLVDYYVESYKELINIFK